MRELQLVGLSADGSTLILADDTGEEFGVPADGRLKAALRGDRARLAQLEIEMDSALRPREIQARIRAGESPEAVAQLAHASVDKIMGYAVPVLAERQHIADRARRSAVRRKGGDGHGRPLGDCVTERLARRGVDPASAEWDAWRRDDGRWTISVDYRSGESERHATFVYDVGGRYAVADNDDGRWLLGEQSSSHGPQPRESGQPRRLAAVRSDSDALALDDESTVDLSETVAELRQAEETGMPEPQPVAAPDDAASADDMAALADVVSGSSPETGRDDGPDQAAADASDQAPRRERRARKERRRARVPSWEEIMFGRGGGKE